MIMLFVLKSAFPMQEKDAFQHQIAAADNPVYQLYGLTPEEINIVENA